MRRLLTMTAALVAAVFLWRLLSLPAPPAPAAGTVDDDVCRRTVAGAFHVHSVRSDGAGDVDAIAAAAARAGLRFVILTDHGDGTTPPEEPRYLHGVLMVDAVEISTDGGHYVAVDMPAAPYRLGGQADGVVEDVARLGGFGIAAHPDSPKPELRWTSSNAGIDGFEWMSLDSEWRDESRLRLARVVADYPFRKGPALASLLDRPEASLERWDAQTSVRPLVGLAAHDAHGGLIEGGARGPSSLFGVPSYEATFRTFGVRAIVDAELTGKPAQDARSVLDAIRRGRVFSAIDAVAAPAFVDYRAVAGPSIGRMGETLPFEPGIRLSVRSTVPPDGRIVLLRDGKMVAESRTDALEIEAAAPGAYRVEVRSASEDGRSMAPWLVTNPIYLRGQLTGAPTSEPTYSTSTAIVGPGRAETDPTSQASVSSADGQVTLRFTLGSGQPASQFAALVLPLPPGSDGEALTFDARASAPMRVSVQLRFDSLGGARWRRSVYVAPGGRQIAVPFALLLPADGRHSARPPLQSASSVLFVIDLVNAKPGASGSLEISRLSVVR
jgi:hypothetical protein